MGPDNLQPGNYNPAALTQAQRQWLFNYFGNVGQAPAGYGGQNVTGETSNYTPGESAANIAQQNYAGQAQLAEGTLAAAGTSLAQQYANLLAKVTGQGQYGINTATSSEEAALAKAGILGMAGDTALTNAQMGAETTAAANEGSVQTAAAGAQTQIAEDIAGIQTGAAGTNLNYGLNVGSLAQQLAVAELPYNTLPANYNVTLNPNQTLAVPSTVASSIKFLPGGGGAPDSNNKDEAIMQAIRILNNLDNSSRKPQASMSRFVH